MQPDCFEWTAGVAEAISQALPVAEGDAVAKPARFIGHAQALTFYAPLPESIGGGLYQQRLSIDHQRLYVRLARLQGTALQAFGAPQLLLRDVQQLAFSYRGLTPLAKDSGWLTEWPWPERLPKAVRIEATLSGAVPWVREQVSVRLDLASEPGAL